MEFKLQCGDTIAIPDGCKATIKDRSVVFEKEFKDGDVLHSKHSSTILIFKEMSEDDSRWFYSHYNTDNSSNKGWNKVAFRPATEEEKKLLFDKMKEQGLKWNADEKRVENIRWRASSDERYYYINHFFECQSDIEESHIFDEDRWNVGNYFKNKEQAEEAIKRIKEVLYNYHEEIGE